MRTNDPDDAMFDRPLPSYRGLMTAAARMRRDRDEARLIAALMTLILAAALGFRACERRRPPSAPIKNTIEETTETPSPAAPGPIETNREPVGSEGAFQGWTNGSRIEGGDTDLPIGAVSSFRPARGSLQSPRPPIASLLAAIRMVESSGDDRAVGDSGRSLGPYQISRAYWLDGGGDPARYETDVWSPRSSRRVVLAYWRRYASAALTTADLEKLARIHNGGPAGDRMAATRRYWMKVKNAMRRDES